MLQVSPLGMSPVSYDNPSIKRVQLYLLGMSLVSHGNPLRDRCSGTDGVGVFFRNSVSYGKPIHGEMVQVSPLGMSPASYGNLSTKR